MSGSTQYVSMNNNNNNQETQVGDGLMAFVLIPLVLCSLFAAIISCVLVFQYQGQDEWASTTSSLRPYDIGTPEKIPAIAPVPASFYVKSVVKEEKVPLAQN